MANNDKNKKPQTPGRGKPRKPVASVTVSATGDQANTYANDPDLTMQPLVPAAGYTDYRPKPYKGGSAQTFVNGHGLDMSQAENRSFVRDVTSHEHAMFRRRAKAEQEAFDRASRQMREQRYREGQARRNQERLDRNFERGVFSTREGWENLGRANGRDKDGNEVSYGRGAAGVENYDARYNKLKKRADKLTKFFADGDYTGRGQEWAAIRKLVADTHANGGLTEKQLTAVKAKMDALLGGLNERITYNNKANEYQADRDIARKRKAIGDDAGILSDDQVNAAFDKRKWDNIRGALENYGPTGDRFDALRTMLGNGVSTNQLVRIAVNSGEGDWEARYNKLLSSNLSKEELTSGIEDLGVEFLKQQLDQGDAGVKALNDAITNLNTWTGKKPKAARTKELSWDDEEERSTPSGSVAEPDKTSLVPQEARTVAENAEMYRQGATAEEVRQPGPTTKRADAGVQAAGNIAEAAAQAGVLPPALTPRDTTLMKTVPGSHQSDGSMGAVTPLRAAGLPDLQANFNESLSEAGIPLTPRKTGEPPAPAPKKEPNIPSVMPNPRLMFH